MYASVLQQINRVSMESRRSLPDSMIRERILKQRDECISAIDKALMDNAKSAFVTKPVYISAYYQIIFREISYIAEDQRKDYIMTHPAIGELIEQLKTKFTGCVVGAHNCFGVNGESGVEFTVSVRLHP